MIIEKIPNLTCNICGSTYVIKTNEGTECDDCGRLTVQTSDFINQKKKKQNLTLNFMEIDNEVA